MKLKKLIGLCVCSLVLCSVASAKGDKAKKSFDEIDADKDGKISLAEFTTGAKDEAKAKARFEKKDKDSDGFLSKEEFAKKKAPKKEPKEKKPKQPKKPKKDDA